MKRFIYIFLICVIGLTSCVSYEQRIMEKKVSRSVDARGFTGFEEYQTIRLYDEVNDLLNIHRYILGWDKSFYEAFAEAVNDPAEPQEYKDYNTKKMKYYEKEIAKEENLISYLETIEYVYPEIYTDVSFIIYRMSYMYLSSNGEIICDACYGRFNKERELVAFKQSIRDDWEIIGKTVSVPGFYTFIDQDNEESIFL